MIFFFFEKNDIKMDNSAQGDDFIEDIIEDIEQGPNGIPSEDGSLSQGESVEEVSQGDVEVRHVSESQHSTSTSGSGGEEEVGGGEEEAEETCSGPCSGCPNCSPQPTFAPTSVPDCTTSPCCSSGSSGSSGSSSGGLDIEMIVNTISTLLPLFTSLNSMGSSSLFSSSSPEKCSRSLKLVEIAEQFQTLCDGLDSISNDKIRAICFMDRLNKFHDHFWNDETVSTTGDVEGTASTLMRRRIQGEISNVMEQLTH